MLRQVVIISEILWRIGDSTGPMNMYGLSCCDSVIRGNWWFKVVVGVGVGLLKATTRGVRTVWQDCRKHHKY